MKSVLFLLTAILLAVPAFGEDGESYKSVYVASINAYDEAEFISFYAHETRDFSTHHMFQFCQSKDSVLADVKFDLVKLAYSNGSKVVVYWQTDDPQKCVTGIRTEFQSWAI